MKPKVVAIIQSRVGSIRLPEKVLRIINDETLLYHVVSRTMMAKSVETVVVATTINKGDDTIKWLCKGKHWSYYRGSEPDVLDRYYMAARAFGADVIVRITADCPLIDMGVIDDVVGKFLSLYPNIDYVSNLMPRTYPRGLDVEAVSFDVLQKVWREDFINREHVTLNIRQHPELFKTSNIASDKDYSYLRWTVDTAEDLEFTRKVYRYFGGRTFGWLDVIQLLNEYPDMVIRDTSPILEAKRK